MGRKKKRAAPDPRSRIFCYYCDRTFNNEQELLMHQREKHLRCPTCNKRRTSTQVDVLGMKGVPDEYYLALEGKSAKKTAYQDNAYQSYPQQTYPSQGSFPQSYPGYQGYAPHAYQPHQYAAQQYATQPYGSQPYAHNYQQHPQHYAYSAQGYPAQNRAHHGYDYSSQHPYPAHGYQSHRPAYPQQTYGPTQPVSNSQTRQTPTDAAPKSSYSQTTTTIVAQPQTNGPRPVPDEKPPPLPVVDNESKAAKVAKAADKNPAPAASSPVAKPVVPSEPGITVIFDRTDMSMEEMRAQLPRYRVSSSSG